MDFQSPQNGLYDPSSFIDPSAIANNQINGARTYPMSSIPQKRDATGLSRSQTPSSQPPFGLQQGFAHTPSPIMANQHFRPGQMQPQRMQTASPAQNPHHGQQMSPMGFPQSSPMAQQFDMNAGGQFPVQQVQSVQLSQNLQNRQQEAQRQYAMRLQAQQQQLGNLAASNIQRAQAMNMPGMGAPQPSAPPQMMAGMPPQMHNAQIQAQNFINNVKALMTQHRRPFNSRPQVAGRIINLHQLYMTVNLKFKGYAFATKSNLWPQIAIAIGVHPQQYPSAPEELRLTYEQNLSLYEQAYRAKQAQQQQQQTGMQMQPQAGQMGQMGPQMSPTRGPAPGQPSMNPAAQQEYMAQLQRKSALMQQQQRQPESMQQQHQPFESPAQPRHSTPMQLNATPALENGNTPQPDNAVSRKSLSRPPDGTPTPGPESVKIDFSPAKIGGTDGIVKSETVIGTDTRPRGPASSVLDGTWGLLRFDRTFHDMIDEKIRLAPNTSDPREHGIVDIRSLTMSLRSGLQAETRLALDMFFRLSHEMAPQFELQNCEDLVDVLVDCAEDQLDILSDENPEVTDIIDLNLYEDVIHNCQIEANSLQDMPKAGTKEYRLDRTADRLLAITAILRNLSFFETNFALLCTTPVLKFISNAIRLVGTRILLLRSHMNTFDFMKDLVIFFSNVSTKVELPSRDDAYAILHFLCAFAPSPRPGKPTRFAPYNPRIHQYLPPAVDSLAKLLARDDPNRTYYKQILIIEATSDPPYDLLTRAFALAIAVVPDRTEGKLHDIAITRPNHFPEFEERMAEIRKPFLMQGMLAADILASLAPGPESGVCRAWLEAEDGWALNLLKFVMSLSSTMAKKGVQPPPPQALQRGQRPIADDRENIQLIVHRALSMLKRLGEKSTGMDPLVKRASANGADHVEEDSDGDMEDFEFGGTTWKISADVLPRKETVLGALLMSELDPRSLRQFCGLGYLAD